MEEEWIKGTVTVENGVVVAVQSEGQSPAPLGEGTLTKTLNDLAEDGWEFDGELPPYNPTEGRYVLKIKKRKSLML
jgi:hypothetical protein